jgi:chemotaxis signal transduction protein
VILDPKASARHLATLREEFDLAFSRPQREQARAAVDLLCLRVADQAYAVRLAEVSAVLVDRPIVRQPSALPELLGLCAARGLIVPLYDLGMLLCGHPSNAPRFALQASHSEPIGFAFDALDGQRRVAAEQIARVEPQANAAAGLKGELAPEILTGADVARPIVSVAAAIAAIEQKLGLHIGARSDGP